MQETLTPTEQEFVRAVRSNNYAEIQLSPNIMLITDWEVDGEFVPWVSVEDDALNAQDIDDALSDIDIFDYEEVVIECQDGVSIDFGEFRNVEFNYDAEEMIRNE